MSLFSSLDYKRFISDQIECHASIRGYQGRLAEAAGCQRSYFSLVMRSHHHLSLDQAMGLATFWHLDSDEVDWFLELVNFSRAESPMLKRRLREKLTQMKERREDLAEKFKKPRLEMSEKEYLYYSSWVWSAIHILTSVPAYRRIEKIAERLSLPRDWVLECLKKLEAMGIVKGAAGEWKIVPGGLFAPKGSFVAASHHGNWRQRAVLDAQQGRADSVHYTDVCSVSVEDFARFKDQLREWIESFRKQVSASKEEEVICVALDCFRV